MPERLTLDNVINYVNEKSNGDVKVLSTEYINVKTPLKLQCSCGKIFYRNFGKIKTNNLNCPQCTLNKQSERYRKSFIDVLEDIKNNGCEYIKGEYINSNSKLTLRCACGNTFIKSYNKFMIGQSHCPNCGMKMLAKNKTKYTSSDAKIILKKYGYNMDECNYVNAATPIKCKCKNGHDCNIILSQLLVGRSGCKQCANDSRKLYLSHFWNNGESNVQDEIRKGLKEWRRKIYKKYNYKCPITGAGIKDCDIHHLVSFETILRNACDKYEDIITHQTKIKDFSSYNIFELIKKEVIEAHDENMGILIDKSIHKRFHKEYGYGNNTPSQFDEFLFNNYCIHLKDIIII